MSKYYKIKAGKDGLESDEVEVTIVLQPENLVDLCSVLDSLPVNRNCTLIKCLKSDLENRLLLGREGDQLFFEPLVRKHQYDSVR